MKRSSLTVARLIIATAALAFGSAHAVIPYRVTDLGPGSALSINNVGQVPARPAANCPGRTSSRRAAARRFCLKASGQPVPARSTMLVWLPAHFSFREPGNSAPRCSTPPAV
jgi:hypothetical protein